MEIREPPATYSAYRLLPEGAPRYQIVGGVPHLTPSPGRVHQKVSAALFQKLLAHVSSRGLGEVYYAPFDVVLSESDVVQPDILFVAKERLQIIRDGGVFGAPDLVVEILSPHSARLDLVQKLSLYARHGVREYWIIDPANRSVDLWTSQGEALDVRCVLAHDGALQSSVLAGLVIPLGEIFSF